MRVRRGSKLWIVSPITKKPVKKVIFLSKDKSGYPERDLLLVYPGTRHVFRWPKFWVRPI